MFAQASVARTMQQYLELAVLFAPEVGWCSLCSSSLWSSRPRVPPESWWRGMRFRSLDLKLVLVHLKPTLQCQACFRLSLYRMRSCWAESIALCLDSVVGSVVLGPVHRNVPCIILSYPHGPLCLESVFGACEAVVHVHGCFLSLPYDCFIVRMWGAMDASV